VHEIEVERIGPGNAVALVVGGEPVDGDVVPLPDGVERVSVRVLLGD